MKKLFNKKKKSALENEIEQLLSDMSVWAPDSEEYTRMNDNLAKLYVNLEKERTSKDNISKGEMLAAGVTIGSTLLIVFAEETRLIRTTALQIVGKTFKRRL